VRPLSSVNDETVNWWRMTGSNRRPPACKAGALPAELIPHRSRTVNMVGLVGLEPTTPALSRRCSNQLSYRPFTLCCEVPARIMLIGASPAHVHTLCSTTADKSGRSNLSAFSRKEVIQPHLPIRLPCYDFTPVTNPAVVIALLAVRLTTSGRTRSHGVTGGVYKTRERIHRGKLIRDY
jgi:hypothetical protein